MALLRARGGAFVGHRLGRQLDGGGVGRQGPLDQRERPGGHSDDAAVLFALGHRREARAHRRFGRLPDVREEVLLEGDLADGLVVERFAFAPEDLDGGFGKGHGTSKKRMKPRRIGRGKLGAAV